MMGSAEVWGLWSKVSNNPRKHRAMESLGGVSSLLTCAEKLN